LGHVEKAVRRENGREFYPLERGVCATFAALSGDGFRRERTLSTASSVLVVAGERLARYGFGDGHPFGPDRHAAFYAEFTARGLDKRARIVETRAASRA
jgi:hypothetical protein